jgi:ECF sigma factor
MSRRRQAKRLRRPSTGDKEAEEQLYREVYRELLRMARGCLRGEGPEHTLQATALVNEVYAKLVALGATVIGEKTIERGGQSFVEIAYGWQDLSRLNAR